MYNNIATIIAIFLLSGFFSFVCSFASYKRNYHQTSNFEIITFYVGVFLFFVSAVLTVTEFILVSCTSTLSLNNLFL